MNINQDVIKGLCQRGRVLEAQIKGYNFSFPILEVNRLNIRSCLPGECIPNFWNSSRDVLNRETRSLMALVSEYYQIQTELNKLDRAHPDVNESSTL